jgi:hypothetical protein
MLIRVLNNLLRDDDPSYMTFRVWCPCRWLEMRLLVGLPLWSAPMKLGHEWIGRRLSRDLQSSWNTLDQTMTTRSLVGTGIDQQARPIERHDTPAKAYPPGDPCCCSTPPRGVIASELAPIPEAGKVTHSTASWPGWRARLFEPAFSSSSSSW